MVEMTSAEMTDEEDASLEIRVLGDFAVLRNGENVCLPPSRKTRALLAYLAVTNHPQHRDRLCNDVLGHSRRPARCATMEPLEDSANRE